MFFFYLNPVIFCQLMVLRVINFTCVLLHGVSTLVMAYVTLSLDNDNYKTEKSVFKLKFKDFTDSEQHDVLKDLQRFILEDELSKKDMLGEAIRSILVNTELGKVVENGEVSVGAMAVAISAVSTFAHCLYVVDPFYDRRVVYGRQNVRWMEYALSASLMNVTLAIMIGVRDTERLNNIFATSMSTQMTGYAISASKSHTTKLGLFGVGCYYQWLSLSPTLDRFAEYQKFFSKRNVRRKKNGDKKATPNIVELAVDFYEAARERIRQRAHSAVETATGSAATAALVPLKDSEDLFEDLRKTLEKRYDKNRENRGLPGFVQTALLLIPASYLSFPLIMFTDVLGLQYFSVCKVMAEMAYAVSSLFSKTILQWFVFTATIFANPDLNERIDAEDRFHRVVSPFVGRSASNWLYRRVNPYEGDSRKAKG